jgi:hypothetical protein
MATTVGRCFDIGCHAVDTRSHTKQQMSTPEDSSSGLLGTGHYDVASEVIAHGMIIPS